MKKEEVSAGLGKEAVRERRKIKIKSFKKGCCNLQQPFTYNNHQIRAYFFNLSTIRRNHIAAIIVVSMS